MDDTRRALLAALAEGPVSGPELAERLDISRAAVWKQVEALRDEGFEIDGGGDGYEVTAIPRYGAAAIQFGLEAPYSVEYHRSVGSTNDRARELAASGAENVLVVADEQTGGRGRLRRGWSSPPGGVWLSLLLRPRLPPPHFPVFTLAAAVAVTRACREVGVEAVIKWPNDVLVSEANEGKSERSSDGVLVSETNERTSESDHRERTDGVLVNEANEDTSGNDRGGRKLVGILTEMEGEADRVSWLIVGMGINANIDADSLPPGATSIREQVGDVDRRVFVQRVAEEFHAISEAPDEILPAWREYAATLGQRVRVETPGGVIEGEAVDVEFPGALVVETDRGRERVHAGDCEHLRPA
jgi:BirA family biotin operon repressor/biotin-[acetyl-CoA-carboxylase] ligase